MTENKVRDALPGVIATGGSGWVPCADIAIDSCTTVDDVPIDPCKSFVFPNRLRDERRKAGFVNLLRFAAIVPEIPYIRLSKIERGEVFARAGELRRIAEALGIAPTTLLIDVDALGFDLGRWASQFDDGRPIDAKQERFAILLGAALRARRVADDALSIASIERDFGLAPVNLSRVENAAKPFSRWNAAIQSSILKIFGMPDEAALRDHVEFRYHTGALASVLDDLANPAHRLARTRSRIAELRAELADECVTGLHASRQPRAAVSSPIAQHLPVYGSPGSDGLIAFTPTATTVRAMGEVSPGSFALNVCRATLGGGLPAGAVVIVDPAKRPVPGSVAVVREGENYRLLIVSIDKTGALVGYSTNPDREVALDDLAADKVAGITGAIYP